jgi:hypothetical protein
MENVQDFCLKIKKKTVGKVAVFINNCYEQNSLPEELVF